MALVIEGAAEPKGLKAGASGLNLGPEAEKLKSLLAGKLKSFDCGEKADLGEKAAVAAAAISLALDEAFDGWLMWLEEADWGGLDVDAWKPIGWKLLAPGWKLGAPKLNWPGVKLLVGLNLNSAAPAFNLLNDDLLLWLGRRDPDLSSFMD